MRAKMLIATFIVMSILGCNSGNIKGVKSGIGILNVLPNQQVFAEVVIANEEVVEVN